jgi:hypothetical protein
MASRKGTEDQDEPRIAEAAERAGSLIRQLESRLRARSDSAVPAKETVNEPEDLEKQLHDYFETTVADEIRNRVIDGVVDRILREWDQPRQETAGSVESEVLKRLIDRVLERLAK